MIEIGCNYSPELMDLIWEKKVDVDWIKLSKEDHYHRQFKAVNGARPVLLHFAPRVTTDQFADNWDLEGINKAILECRSPHVALHLRAVESDIEGLCSNDVLERYVVAQLLKKKRELLSDVLVENMPITCLPDKLKTLTDPGFISRICEKVDVGLCLDMAHAQISAYYRNESIDDYLEALPLNRVREVHLSSIRIIDNEMRDAHEFLEEHDYKLLERLLRKTCPNIITLEYGGEGIDCSRRSDKSKIENQLNIINELVGR